jgi:hypothetical protein
VLVVGVALGALEAAMQLELMREYLKPPQYPAWLARRREPDRDGVVVKLHQPGKVLQWRSERDA